VSASEAVSLHSPVPQIDSPLPPSPPLLPQDMAPIDNDATVSIASVDVFERRTFNRRSDAESRGLMEEPGDIVCSF
jgi:hypothetical protein